MTELKPIQKLLQETKISDLLPSTKDVITIPASASIGDAVQVRCLHLRIS
jgi:hypothetical protein